MFPKTDQEIVKYTDERIMEDNEYAIWNVAYQLARMNETLAEISEALTLLRIERKNQ
jgi:hypothetical protein